MQAIEALLQRRSAGKLIEPAPDAGALELIFESAARAPDHGHLRPWRFIVIQGAGREKFGELMADHARRVNPSAAEDSLQRERQKALRAPMIMVVAAICTPGGKIPVVEQILSAGAAAQNVLLAAFNLGFNGVWKTGGCAYDDVTKQALGLQSKDAIVGFLYLGTESSTPKRTSRPWRDLVQHWNG